MAARTISCRKRELWPLLLDFGSWSEYGFGSSSAYDELTKELKLDSERYHIDSLDEMRLHLNYEHTSGRVKNASSPFCQCSCTLTCFHLHRSFAYLFSSMVGSIKLFDGPGGDTLTTTMEWTVVVKDGMIALTFPCQAGQRIRKKLDDMMESMERFVEGGLTGPNSGNEGGKDRTEKVEGSGGEEARKASIEESSSTSAAGMAAATAATVAT